jgi:hypothetical protein
MSDAVADSPFFVTFVSSLSLSFLSESESVSSFVSLSNFWTVPETCLLAPVSLDAVAPVPDAPVLDEPVAVSPDILPDEPELVVSELVLPFPIELEPGLDLSVEAEPDVSLDDPVAEVLVPLSCACAGTPSTSSPATPRPATAPHAIRFMSPPSRSAGWSGAAARAAAPRIELKR